MKRIIFSFFVIVISANAAVVTGLACGSINEKKELLVQIEFSTGKAVIPEECIISADISVGDDIYFKSYGSTHAVINYTKGLACIR